MKLEINGVGVETGTVSLPRYGTWRADLELETGAAMSGKATIVAGNLTLIGEIVPDRGGASGSIARYLVKGGMAWDKPIKPRPYQSDAGVRVQTLIADIAREIGEQERIVLPADRWMGRWYSRPGSKDGVVIRAKDALTSLCPKWWLDPLGVVQCSERIGSIVSAEAQVMRRNLARQVRTVATDNVLAFMPGSTFEGFVIVLTVIQVAKSGSLVSVWGES